MCTTNGFTRTLGALAVIGGAQLSLPALASAQGDTLHALYISAATVPTNMAGIHTLCRAAQGIQPCDGRR